MHLFERTPADFNFLTAACSHGFFALAPNRWDLQARALITTVLADDAPFHVRVKAARRDGRDGLRMSVPDQNSLTTRQGRALRGAVRRMLRLDENLADFHTMCARDSHLGSAAEARFGRLLRSPSLFEDVVKTMCTCNITWRQTLTMVKRLVERYGHPAANDPAVKAFPTPESLGSASEAALRASCGVGYRAGWIIAFARQVTEGDAAIGNLQDPDLPTADLHRRLRAIRGVGDYAASCLCMLLGRYDRLAIDTVLVEHYGQRFPRRKQAPANIKKHYARYHPYQYLVYWWELWSRHVDADGHPASWTDGAT